MKAFFATLLVLVLAFAGIKMIQTSSAPAVQASTKQEKQENMTKFSNDLATYMTAVSAKELEVPKDAVKISARCKPDKGAYGTRCWLTIGTPLSDKVDKATAENVRRRGDKFVWDHES